MSREELIRNATHILELSVDEVTKGGEGELICKIVAKRRNTDGEESENSR